LKSIKKTKKTFFSLIAVYSIKVSGQKVHVFFKDYYHTSFQNLTSNFVFGSYSSQVSNFNNILLFIIGDLNL